MNQQEIFDKVGQHLMKQGRPSLQPVGSSGRVRCAYRGVSGAKCAAGIFIPDEAYSQHLEGLSVMSAKVKSVAEFGRWTDLEVWLLMDLQQLHDYAIDVESENVRDFWYEKLSDMARRKELSINKVSAAYIKYS